jgi:cation diffusion facilitator family transporter
MTVADAPDAPDAPGASNAPRVLTARTLMLVSVGVALFAIATKTLAWRFTGSVGLLSDALESLVNLAAALFGLWMVTVAARPADKDHPFGHGKAEYFSSAFEGLMIFAAAIGIFWTAIPRLWEPEPLMRMGLGLLLSLSSSLANGALALVMLRAARARRSIALEADARHLLADVWTSAGVLLGLLVVMFTGLLWLDAVVAIAVAVNIVREGARLMWRSAQGLMDVAMEARDCAAIDDVLLRHASANAATGPVWFDHIVTRRAGQQSFVDLHMHVPGHWTLTRAALLRDAVERDLIGVLTGLHARIELLPIGQESASEHIPGLADPDHAAGAPPDQTMADWPSVNQAA